MMISTNYTRKDWARLAASISIRCVPALTVFAVGVIVFMLPIVAYSTMYFDYMFHQGNQTMSEFLIYSVSDTQYSEYFQYSKYFGAYVNSTTSSLFLMSAIVLGSTLFPLLVTYYASHVTLSLFGWIVRKLKIGPSTDLVVLINGKQLR